MYHRTVGIIVFLAIAAPVSSLRTPEPSRAGFQDSTSVAFLRSTEALRDTRTFRLAIADVDLDGDSDAFMADYLGTGALWLNDGSGAFASLGAIFGDVNGTLRLACGDLDGDGDPDVILGKQEETGGNPVYLNQHVQNRRD